MNGTEGDATCLDTSVLIREARKIAYQKLVKYSCRSEERHVWVTFGHQEQGGLSVATKSMKLGIGNICLHVRLVYSFSLSRVRLQTVRSVSINICVTGWISCN